MLGMELSAKSLKILDDRGFGKPFIDAWPEIAIVTQPEYVSPLKRTAPSFYRAYVVAIITEFNRRNEL